jgi:hypothetical protein
MLLQCYQLIYKQLIYNIYQLETFRFEVTSDFGPPASNPTTKAPV